MDKTAWRLQKRKRPDGDSTSTSDSSSGSTSWESYDEGDVDRSDSGSDSDGIILVKYPVDYPVDHRSSVRRSSEECEGEKEEWDALFRYRDKLRKQGFPADVWRSAMSTDHHPVPSPVERLKWLEESKAWHMHSWVHNNWRGIPPYHPPWHNDWARDKDTPVPVRSKLANQVCMCSYACCLIHNTG